MGDAAAGASGAALLAVTGVFGAGGPAKPSAPSGSLDPARLRMQWEYDAMAAEEGARDAGSTAGEVKVAREAGPDPDTIVMAVGPPENREWGAVAFLARTNLHVSLVIALFCAMFLAATVAILVLTIQTGTL